MEILRRRQARQALIDFTQFCNRNYRVAEVHRTVASALDQVITGEINRLMIMLPPRHGKSELASRNFPAKYLAEYPERDVISASYGSELSLDFSRDVQRIVSSPEYRALYPGVTLAPDSQAKDRWHTNRGGGYVAAGIGTAITGRGAHLFNIDDPVKSRADAESEQIRKLTWDWYRAVGYTRLMPGAAIVLTLTRWHEEDLCGKLLQQEADGGDQWKKVILPAIDPQTGKALWEEAYPLEVLQQIRRTIGEYDWHALYEQQPRPPGGSFFTEADLLVGGAPVEFPPEGGVPVSGMAKPDYVFAVIDTAVKTGKQHDGLAVTYFCGVRHGQMPWPLLVLDYDLKQVEGALLENWLPTVFRRLEEFAEATKALYGSLGAWIEDKASGSVLLQQAQNHGWPAQAIESGLTAMGKAERAIDVSSYVVGGSVKFTRQAYERTVTYKGVTKNHLLSQILSFRAGTQETAADDLLDCFSYALALSLGNKLGF